jgi:hypothetical protein
MEGSLLNNVIGGGILGADIAKDGAAEGGHGLA